MSDNNNDDNQEFVFIDEWQPGTTEKTTRIPTAYRSASEWGVQVLNPTETQPEEFVVPTKLMSIVKGDFRRYLANLIRAMQDHVCGIIEKNGTSVNRDKIRYCITMENSYKFFFRKSEMRQVAVNAGLISKEDSTKRLLLIKREDAAAMHFEEEHFRPEGKEKKAFNSKFLQIFFRHDTCHLSLQEAIKLSAYNDKRKAILQEVQDAKKKSAENKNNEDDNTTSASESEEEPAKEPYFRNVRGVRSATLPFNFIQKLILNLKAYVDKNMQNCINCSNRKLSDEHETSYDPSSADFKKGFLAYIKVNVILLPGVFYTNMQSLYYRLNWISAAMSIFKKLASERRDVAKYTSLFTISWNMSLGLLSVTWCLTLADTLRKSTLSISVWTRSF